MELPGISHVNISNPDTLEKVKSFLLPLHINRGHAKLITDVFLDEIERKCNSKPSSLRMLNTFVNRLPNGKEDGKYLAIDLGGTNFRCILLNFENGVITEELVKSFKVTKEQQSEHIDKLFSHIAKCLVEFCHENDVKSTDKIPLGFCFSFPVDQKSLSSAIFGCWTKTFKCPGGEGKDVVKLLSDSIKKQGYNNIEVVAILNDTAGTLLQGVRMDPTTRIAIILGTGCNGCYIEKASYLKHFNDKYSDDDYIVVNVEWGAFGDNGRMNFIKTTYDIELDKHSTNSGTFTFEKYISGRYLGELVRLIMIKMIDVGLLMSNVSWEKFRKTGLMEPWSFTTDYISKIEMDNLNRMTSETNHLLNEFGLKHGVDYDDDDLALVKHIAGVVSLRAATLVSILTAAILKRVKTNQPNAELYTVAIDGSLYKYHPRFKACIERVITILEPMIPFKLMLAEDGSGKGAGVVAAIAVHQRSR